jgi:hypothetical protein
MPMMPAGGGGGMMPGGGMPMPMEGGGMPMPMEGGGMPMPMEGGGMPMPMDEAPLGELSEDISEAGRDSDTVIGHLTLGEIVVPLELLDEDMLGILSELFSENGISMNEFTVGDERNKINPETGNPEFYYYGYANRDFTKPGSYRRHRPAWAKWGGARSTESFTDPYQTKGKKFTEGTYQEYASVLQKPGWNPYQRPRKYGAGKAAKGIRYGSYSDLSAPHGGGRLYHTGYSTTKQHLQGRPHDSFRYRDPISGQMVTRSRYIPDKPGSDVGRLASEEEVQKWVRKAYADADKYYDTHSPQAKQRRKARKRGDRELAKMQAMWDQQFAAMEKQREEDRLFAVEEARRKAGDLVAAQRKAGEQATQGTAAGAVAGVSGDARSMVASAYGRRSRHTSPQISGRYGPSSQIRPV